LHCESVPWQKEQGLLEPYLLQGSDKQNERVSYAWQISKDPNFIGTLDCENGKWNEDRWHDPSANTVGTDYGWGVNDFYHPHIVWADGDRFFWDYKFNLDKTYELYASGTRFYCNTPSKIAKSLEKFGWR